MKKFYVLVLLLFMGFAFGQSRIVAKKVNEFILNNKQAVEFNLFSKSKNVQKAQKYTKAATDVTILDLNKSELQKIINDAPGFISLKVPYKDEIVDVQLYQQNIFTDSFEVLDKKDNKINYNPGKYYRGIIKGNNYSLVAISFFENNVIGVVSSTELGNIVLGKSIDKQDYVLYSDRNLLMLDSFNCQFDRSKLKHENLPVFEPFMLSKAETENCVKIYYELDYDWYLAHESNSDDLLDWMTGIHNNVETLYNNDGINIGLHSIGIWTTQDPYNPPMDVDSFLQSISNMGADIGNYISYREEGAGGLAPLDGLCTGNNYSISGLVIGYENVPVFSETIHVLAHEMGHILGSLHTQDCVWNGNNTAIDECGWMGGENCGNPGYPENGGTIMSYCHWIEGVGVNFNEGFGPQPGALIRNTVDSKECLDTNCLTDFAYCEFTIQELKTIQQSPGFREVHITDETSSEWLYQLIEYEDVINDNWIHTNLPVFTINESELTQNKYYKIIVKNVCEGIVGGGHLSSLFLTGNFCDGTLFIDTGGENGNYGSFQHIVKTFYPSAEGEKVRIDFQKFMTVNTVDFIYVYNGTSTSSSLFDGGILTGYGLNLSFVSTDDSGAITIEFISHKNTLQGWEAVVDCSALGIEDMSDSYGITVYPNPSSDVLNIASQNARIESVMLTDTAGRTVLTHKISNTNGTINIGHLPKGAYILSLKLDGQTVTKKIIKR